MSRPLGACKTCGSTAGAGLDGRCAWCGRRLTDEWTPVGALQAPGQTAVGAADATVTPDAPAADGEATAAPERKSGKKADKKADKKAAKVARKADKKAAKRVTRRKR